jgi:hypothetical protein
MTTSDGAVLSTTKIIDNGPAARRRNLVILGDGYRASEMTKYHTDVQNFVNRLNATAPFDDLWCFINVYRVDVASTDSGADDPATCGDGTTGTGATVDTYFDSTFCFNNTRRLLVGNSATALSVSRAQVPQGQVTLVIVNTPIYGGAGGAVAWFSTNPASAEIGIHEMGHTYFGLTDEYSDRDDNHSGSEPVAPNATVNTDRDTIKWRTFIQPTTPLPTTTNNDCTTNGPTTSPVAAGTVGAFEGADRARCRAYRPEFDCKMRTLSAPFCAVCKETIRRKISGPDDDVDAACITLRRVSGSRFVSTKVLHVIDSRLNRDDTATDRYLKSTSNGFLRAELDTLGGPLIKDIEVNQ